MNENDYSQHGEQPHILDFFKDFKGRFLDIGAFDGKTGSNTFALAELGWSGICIEANPASFAKLVETHKDNPSVICVNSAVMDRGGLVEFAHSREPQLCTCKTDNIPGEWKSGTFWVSSVSPMEVGLQFGFDYDFVSLDVEGVDKAVLYNMGCLLPNTKLLCIEDAIPFHEFNQSYYDSMLKSARWSGLSKIVARTNFGEGRFGNTLIGRE